MHEAVLGFLLLLVGVIIVYLSLWAVTSRSSEGKQRGTVTGFVLFGPIPLIFSSQRFVLVFVLAALFIALFVLVVLS